MRTETVEEYLERGGKVEKVVPNASTKYHNYTIHNLLEARIALALIAKEMDIKEEEAIEQMYLNEYGELVYYTKKENTNGWTEV